MNPDPASLPTRQTFGRYVIQRALGSGAFGAVYEALQQPLGKRVALKVLHAGQTHDAEAVRRFRAEAEATAQLRHPHIIDVVDLGEEDGQPYLAMEFLEGETLAARLAREGRLSARAAVDVMLPIVSAVAAAHDAGVVHRDLKPENIFLATVRPGRITPKLLDFGVAKVRQTERGMTRTGSVIGTVHYMSPEQARESKDVDGRSDQWALAVILYECVTGRMAFPGEAMIDVLTGIIGAAPPPMSDVADLPAGFEAVLLRALQKRREDRYPSTRALGAALCPYASPPVRDEWSAEFGEHAAVDALAVTSGERAHAPLLDSVSMQPQEVLTQRTVDAVMAPSPVARRGVVAFAAVACVAVIALAFALRARPAPTPRVTAVSVAPTEIPPPPYDVSVEATPASAQLAVDGVVVATGRLARSFARDRQTHTLRVSADGYEPAEFSFDDARPLPARVELAPRAQPVAPSRHVVTTPRVRARPAGEGLTGTGIEIH